MFGGTPDYSYQWSNGYSEPTADGLTEGIYDIVIKDIHECEVDTSIEIIEPEKLIISPVFRRPTCRNNFV